MNAQIRFTWKYLDLFASAGVAAYARIESFEGDDAVVAIQLNAFSFKQTSSARSKP